MMTKTTYNRLLKETSQVVVKDFKRNKYKYLIFLPVAIYFIIFCYKPMYGVIIAFKNFQPSLGIMDSPWVGINNFTRFFNDFYFTRILKNTFLISIYSILWGFPVPIIFALLINELKNHKFKRFVQSTTYLPHFISTVIICSMIRQFSFTDGLFNDIIHFLGGSRSQILQHASNFRTLYVASEIWQHFGWNSIIYMAALSSIDPSLYESSNIDGAGRFRQMWHITLPGITPTIIILFILRMGSIFSIGYEKILLLYNEAVYSTADVISTYTYRVGLVGGNYSYGTTVGLFNSVINVLFLLGTNYILSKSTETSLF